MASADRAQRSAAVEAALSPPRFGIRTVWFEETGERRAVVGVCKGGCKLSERILREEPFRYIVSPSGIAHLVDKWGDTDCGHDATREGWWWPL